MFNWLPEPGQLIDSHCHLDASEFAGERKEIISTAQQVGIGQILVPAINAATFPDTLAMRAKFGCWVAFGLHPLYLAQHVDDHLTILEHYIIHHKPIALGEIGLDFMVPDLEIERQEKLFIEQLMLARKYHLPVIVHARRSVDRVLKYLRQIRVVSGLAHAFNGSEQQAAAFLQLGFKLGFGGAMTYTGSKRIRRLAANLPNTALVLETDAPYIRPEWDQSHPNRPTALPRIAQIMAQLRNTRYEEIVETTYYNVIQALHLKQSL